MNVGHFWLMLVPFRSIKGLNYHCYCLNVFFFLFMSPTALLTLSSCLSRQYYFVDISMTWTEAQTYCRQNYTDLATLENAEDTSRLIAAAVNSGYNGLAWIGLYEDLMNNWRWFLEDDTLYGPGEKDYRNWSNLWSPEPNNAGGNEMCTQIDENCAQNLPFFCYKVHVNSCPRKGVSHNLGSDVIYYNKNNPSPE
uniref:C-type lectin domain-containing protein n=1 Tax=Astyanax mexicanus TaxID=7994 RepID=A0A3B1JR28_ASTMX